MSWTITPQTKVPVDPQYGSVSLLLHGNGANGSTTITDNSPSPKTVTAVGNAQISTAQSKFSGASIAFDGTNDYLDLADNSQLGFGLQDFAVELWIYPTKSSTGNNSALLDFRANGLYLYLDTTNTAYALQTSFGNFNNSTLSLLNKWSHVALTRSQDTVRFFIDGVLQTSFAGTALNLGSSAALRVGQRFTSGPDNYQGYIDDLRITKGIARYTANFTPPAAPFPDI
jgi:hypothetical protein